MHMETWRWSPPLGVGSTLWHYCHIYFSVSKGTDATWWKWPQNGGQGNFLTDFIFDQQTAINRVSDVSGHKPGKMHSALKSRSSRTMTKTCTGFSPSHCTTEDGALISLPRCCTAEDGALISLLRYCTAEDRALISLPRFAHSQTPAF